MHERLSRLAAKLLSRSRYERWFEPAFHELHQDFLKRGGTKIGFAVRILAALFSCWLLAAREKTKRGRTAGPGAALARELRFATRLLGKQPGFSFAVIAILALGIGANTAIFSFVHGVLLKPLPYDEPGRLVYLWSRHFEQGREGEGASLPDFLDWREGSEAFESLSAYGPMSFNLRRESGVERIPALFVTADVLRTLRVEPALGRTFLPEETVPGNDRVVLMSDGVWRSHFGGDAAIVGETIRLDGDPYTVVGILPRGFSFPTSQVGFWTPPFIRTGR